jgi:processive 1,2-diacylglycerol beta-glucosyltransferase
MSSGPGNAVVILNADGGSRGHTMRARNFAYLLGRYGFPVEEIDIVSTDPGSMVEFVRSAYRFALAHCPPAWRIGYTRWERIPGMHTLKRRGIAHYFRASREQLTRLQPAAILSTHAYATATAAWLKRESKLGSFLAVAFAGWHVQTFWCFPEVDHYLVLSGRQADVLRGMGIPADRITVCGQIVAPEFRARVPAAEARIRLGLPVDRPVVLAMGGGQGWRLERILPALARLDTPVCAVVFCGNAKRRAQMERRLAHTGSGRAEIRLQDFEPDPSPYFHAADLLVTKPGTLTIAQAFASRTPVLAFAPLPAHEEASLRELCRENAVMVPRPGEPLAEAIERVLADPLLRAETAARASRLMPEDAEEAAIRPFAEALCRV